MQTLPQRGDSPRDFATILGDRFWQQITQTLAIVTDMVGSGAMRQQRFNRWPTLRLRRSHNLGVTRGILRFCIGAVIQ